MVDKEKIKGLDLPCKLAPLPGKFPICDAAGMTRIPRGPLSDTTELPVGTRFHIDYCFFNEVSIRAPRHASHPNQIRRRRGPNQQRWILQNDLQVSRCYNVYNITLFFQVMREQPMILLMMT